MECKEEIIYANVTSIHLVLKILNSPNRIKMLLVLHINKQNNKYIYIQNYLILII